ncbi:NACHT, LRR and PYD domains-containing protein 6 [Lates japonicus]|uniref:NACHT, LRR and PYD domains-containing protein 6 n=1 Tax=Lates japonicus TaxID=270547 RepID=A0AAD3M3Z4_LATJO|nr:NACHT, LRR and PYD domains-containing protein 6 [Lates japonicus]
MSSVPDLLEHIGSKSWLASISSRWLPETPNPPAPGGMPVSQLPSSALMLAAARFRPEETTQDADRRTSAQRHKPSGLLHIPVLFARLKELLYLSFTSGSVAVMLVGRCCPTPLPKYIPVPSRAEENNAQTVGHTGVWEGWERSEHPPSYTDMES